MPNAYNATRRNKEADRFYHSAAWKRCRASKLAAVPWCEYVRPGESEPCGDPATHVHHLQPIATADGWAKRLDKTGLQSVCVSCHNRAEADVARAKLPHVHGLPTFEEDETYRFDAEAADRPVKFIERYFRHYEGRYAGRPFELLDWQKAIVRTLFGWKIRGNGLRRFRELYLLTAKGAGKTPLLAAIGLYMLLMDGEAAPHVISMASTFEQANLTFGGAKGYIRECPDLQPHVEVLQYQVRTRHHGKWTTVSGKPNGRSGPRPSCIIADELHEWPAATGEGFELLTANLFKRSQPLLLTATNAGDSRQSYAYRLHERAVNVRAGVLVDETLLPVIYEAAPDVPWDTEPAAAAANPSLGSIIDWSQLGPQLARARTSPGDEAKYRRLILSQWVTGGANKWLDVPGRWDPCVSAAFAPPPDAALYVGLDLSEGDDLSAAAFVWVTPAMFWVDARFWVPTATAERYQEKDRVEYAEWAAAGHITLLEEVTIGPAVRRRIVAEVLAIGRPAAVAYDRYRADEAVAALAVAGVPTVPVGQGWGVSPGVAELDRRLTERSVTFSANAVLRWNAENVELKQDDRGNRWPVKPNARGTYAGKRSAKIDGISALVTALTEARKHNFPKARATGNAWSL